MSKLIEYVTGDFFEYDADIRINTVNCVGVMGAGVALEFKNRYPEMYKEYVKICKEGEIQPGKPYVWEEYDLFSRCIIINLPTKIHWKNPSKYEYIEKDLLWLREYLSDKSEETVVTLPALGCGHGGLDWDIVRKQIVYYLGELNLKLLVFGPASSNKKYDSIYYRDKWNDSIQIVHKDEKKYSLKMFNTDELYCIGNTDILLLKKLSIICGNSLSEKEVSAVKRIVDEMGIEGYGIVLGLNSKQHLELAKNLLEKGSKLILVIPYGISNFKYYKEIEKYWNAVVILSYVKPNQEFKKYEYTGSLKYRCNIADAILYSSENVSDIRRDYKILKQYNDLFYINYWTERVYEFYVVNAKRIGINPETKTPNVDEIKKCLLNDEL